MRLQGALPPADGYVGRHRSEEEITTCFCHVVELGEHHVDCAFSVERRARLKLTRDDHRWIVRPDHARIRP